jgi:hypothetical protein
VGSVPLDHPTIGLQAHLHLLSYYISSQHVNWANLRLISLYESNFVGLILIRCRFSWFFAIPKMFIARYIGLFIMGPSPSNELGPYCIMQGHLILSHFPLGLSWASAHISFRRAVYTILTAGRHHIFRHKNRTFPTSI